MNRITYLHIVLCLGLAFSTASEALAQQDDQQIAESFVHHGVGLEAKGDILGAVEDYSRALLINLDDQDAQERLTSLVKHPSLSPSLKIDMLLLQDLLGYSKTLDEKTMYFESKRNKLGRVLVRDGIDVANLEFQMNKIRDAVVTKEKISEYEKHQANINATEVPLKIINATLNARIEYLADKFVYLEQQVQRLEEFQSDMAAKDDKRKSDAQEDSKKKYIVKDGIRLPVPEDVSNDEDNKKPEQVAQAPEKNKPIPEKSVPVNEESPKYVPNIKEYTKSDLADYSNEDELRSRFVALQSNLNELEDILLNKDETVAGLRKQVVDLTLLISEKDSRLKKHDARLESLDQELQDLQSRFELGQKIIAEKDSLISKLELDKTQMSDHSNSLEEILSNKDEQLNELNGMLQIYKADLADAKSTVQEKTSLLSTMQSDIAELDNLHEIKELLRIRDHEVEELNEIMDWYKKNLDEADKMVYTRNLRIKALNQEMAGMRNEFNKESRKFKGQENHVNLLKDTLKREQGKREQRNLNLRNIVLDKVNKIDELDGIIEVYKGKLVDANSLIQEKSANITALDGQLSSVQSKLYEKDEALRQTKEELTDLEKELTTVQNRLLELSDEYKGGQGDNDFQLNRSLDKDLTELNAQLNVIHTQINENDDTQLKPAS